MKLGVVFLLALALAGCKRDRRGGPAPGAETAGEAAAGPFYRIDASAAPDCRQGAWCTVRIELTALGGFKVNREYPHKFVPAAAEGLEHDGTGSFSVETDTAGVLTHRFRPAAAGPASVSGTFKLSVCSADQCEIEAVPVEVSVPVS